MTSLCNNKEIAICIPCLTNGGTEIETLNLVKALLETNYSVTVLCYFEYSEEMRHMFSQSGCKVELMSLPRDINLFKLLNILRTKLKILKPNAVHVQYMAPGMIPIIAAKLAGIKNVFATVHAAGKNGYGFKTKLMLRFSSMLADHFFCVSKNTEEFWFGKEPSFKHSVIYNGIDIDKLNQLPKFQISGIASSDFVIGIAGRVVPIKGHACLFKAFAILNSKYNNIKILIVGDGVYKTELLKLSEKLGISSNIIWVSQIPHNEMGKYYKIMNILVMPSHWEGFGLTAAEAMACSIPVIGTRVPGLVEVIGEDEQAGFLIDIDDHISLAKKIQILFNDKSLSYQMASNGAERIKSLYSAKNNRINWLYAYELLLK